MAVPVRKTYLDAPHGQIHCRVAGAGHPGGTPLVCFHMSPASGAIYHRFLARMGEGRPAYAPDTPGFGNSDPLPEYPEIGDYARALQAALAPALTGPVDLIGYHTGSKIAVSFAAQFPAMVRRVLLVSLSVYSAAELETFRARYRPGSLFDLEGDRLRDTWRWFVDFFQVGRVNTLEHAAEIFVERLSGKERHWWGHRAAFNYDPGADLAAIRDKVFILNPDDDLRAITARAEPLVPAGQFVDLAPWTHGFLDTRTDEAAALVEKLLSRP